MFEVLGFIAAFIVGGALAFAGFFVVYMKYGFSGRYDGESVVFTIIGIVGIVIVVLTLKYAPFTIVLN